MLSLPEVWVKFDVDSTTSVEQDSESWSHDEIEERSRLLHQQIVLEIVAVVYVHYLSINKNLSRNKNHIFIE